MDTPESPTHRLLLEAIHAPWTPLHWQARQAGLAVSDAEGLCTEAIERGLAQQSWCNTVQAPVRIVAPTMHGIEDVAKAMHIPVAVLLSICHFTSMRFWVMRCAQPIVQDVTAIMEATARSIEHSKPQAQGFVDARCQLFLPRRHHTQDVFVHGLIELHAQQHLKRFHLLIDHGHSDVWQWAGLLRCLRNWGKSAGEAATHFPTLLIISRGSFRAMTMLALAQMCGLSTPVAATGQLADVCAHGLLPSAGSKQWASVIGGAIVSGVNPLRLASDVPSMPIEPHRVAASKRTAAVIDLTPPVALRRIDQLDSLTPAQQQLLVFLSRNPVLPVSVIATWQSEADLCERLATLELLGLAEQVQTKLDESIWAATFEAMQLLAARQLQPDGWLRRYRFFRADHERRLIHTLTGYRFFAALKEQCQRRSRSMRKLDTRPGTLNTGVIPYYAMLGFESEWMASDWYASEGRLHYWRPDGYGALRAGASVTHFWIEIDGTPNAPSRKDPQVWAGKLDRLCDYVQSGRWQLRYPARPRLLIVTTDLRNRTLIFDALVETARARSMAVPQVWVAAQAAVLQRGALAKIWFNASIGDEVMGYAFENVAPVAVGVNEWTADQRMVGRDNTSGRRRLT